MNFYYVDENKINWNIIVQFCGKPPYPTYFVIVISVWWKFLLDGFGLIGLFDDI